MFWTRPNGHLSDEDLSAYIDGELNPARLRTAAAHLASCDVCNAALDGLREAGLLVSRLPEVAPPRSFVLTPAMAGIGQHRPQQAPKRQSFVFVPAVALTLLVALFAVDLASSGSSSTSSDEAATASEAMIAKDAGSGAGAASSSAAADSGGAAADAPLRSTFSTPVEPTPQTAAAAPNVAPPATGPAATPSSSGQQPAQAPAPTTSGPTTGGAPVPVPSTKPGTESAAAPSPGTPPDAAVTSGALSSEAVPAPAPGVVTDSAGDDDGTSLRNAGGVDDGGPDWLRIAEALTAVAFAASLLYVFGTGLIKKGR